MQLLKVSKAAEILRIDVGTARKWITKGVLPHVRFGRTIRIDADELQRMLRGSPPAAAIDVTGEALKHEVSKKMESA